MRLELAAPADFSFRRTVLSHGWCDLAPFSASTDGRTVRTVVALPLRGARSLEVSSGRRAIVIDSPGPADAATRRALTAAARRILAVDVDLGPFHDAVRADDRFRWIAETRTGRMLRSPTAWEDVVKLVLTTNCSWAFTKKMTATLVDRYGERAPDGSRAFPTPARLAKVPEKEFRDVVRAGYRSPYLVSLSRTVASGESNPASWDDDPRDASALRKEMVRLPGVGPYVAENLLKFIGKPDGLALDSAVRAKYAEVYHGGRRVKDATIERRLAPLGPWAGLALWFDLWRAWMANEPTTPWA